MTKLAPIARLMLLVILMTSLSFSGYGQTVDVDGTSPYRKWDKIVLSLTLPSNVTESNTSFRNTRMDVLFTDPSGKKIRVPGFFAADGNAANTNAKSGKIFKAYLRPYQTGNWKYQVLYYTGNDVALKNVNQLPNPTHNLTGTIGNVTATNATLPDLRAKGRLQYQKTGTNNQRRYLKWAETGEHFLKFGPDSPENLLNYEGFDHDVNKNNCTKCTEHSFSPHSSDWNTGDPTWDGNKGKNLIGAVNYLKNQQMNSMSMSLFGGDDTNVFPWTDPRDKFRYDVSKLEQWEIVFDHAEKNGLMLHFKLAEAENYKKLSFDQIKVYYREMVARYGHHLAIEWNISEEYGNDDNNNDAAPANVIPRINWLASIDPWQNHRVLHTYPGRHEKYYNYLINNNAKLTGASVQSSRSNNYDDAYDGKSGIKTWINKSKNNNIPWVVASDEQNPGDTGMFTSESISNYNVKIEARTKILWKGLIAGGAGVMWYGGKNGDFRTENFNRFATLFDWSKIAILQFFEGNALEYWKMQNNDALASGNKNRCLAQEGKTYIIYLENGGSSNLNLTGQSGNFKVKWFNPRNGGSLQNGSVRTITGGGNKSIGNPPNNTNSDWVALVTKVGGPNVAVTGINVTPAKVTIEAGKTFTLVRSITPNNASDKTVSWDSSNPSIATVNSNGIITAVAKGEVTITGTTQDGDFTSSAVVTVTAAPVVETGCPFEEKNGLLIIEAENVQNYDEALFTLETGKVGTTNPTGTGYLRYNGPDHYGAQVAAHTVAYKIKINNPGEYQFIWRNVRDPKATTGDAANDSWLLIKDNGARFYGKKGGTEYTLTKHTKLWVQKSDFVYECFGETHQGGKKINSMSIWVDFPTAGEYTIEYGGRSNGHSVDRLTLFKANQSDAAKNVNTPESKQEGNCEPANPDPDPNPTTCSDLSLNAVDFPTARIAGFSPAYIHVAENALAINAAQHKNKFAAVAQNFAGADGTYDITITTLAELDGESTYRIKVGGTVIGTYKNPTTTVDYTPTTKTWTGINVKKGDPIQVEFNSHTNGTIPEGNTTAYSRGRWTKLEFTCNGVSNPDPIPNTESIAFSNFPASFGNKETTFPIQVTYSAKVERDINVALKSPTDNHIADQTITVGPGTNKTVTVNVKTPKRLTVDSNYKFVTALRPIGGNYSTNIDKKIKFADIVNAPAKLVLSNDINVDKPNLIAYPSPLGDKDLTVDLSGVKGSASYIISDMNGRSITSGTSYEKTITIPSSALNAKGIYILKVNVNGKQFIKKIVK
ncbi:hypothetical protein A8C32_00655 [Flavivirga aquatica]|uniref:BIG2 domain-containing protein n=1 Tax=Flavivirga aquatica TaxID=1849968 RepID=A0A1E5TBU9_9FLAO|nr:Ig-like domain-containing protein [Flavivirga aquatica]OEK08819.1 hypothetical protein A8C32_00655 [Flavivirga aquatica]